MPLFHMHGVPVGGTAIMLALVASIGGFIFGYDTGQISDIIVLDDFRQRFAGCSDRSDPATCHWPVVRSGLIVALLSVGTLIGALLGAPFAERIGRRYTMIVECCVFAAGVVMQLCTFRSWPQFAAGRLVAGLGIGGLSSVVPMYQAETAPPVLRGTLTATYQLFITAGILTAYSVAIGTRSLGGAPSWRLLIGLGLIFPCALSFGILCMPESPRWLVSKGRFEEAKRSVARAYGIKKMDESSELFLCTQVDDIRQQFEAERSVSAGWIACFRPRNKTLYRTLVVMIIQSFQQLTGANYFFYYGATIFQSVGINDSFITQVILGGVNFGCTFGGLYIMERFGRRWPLILGGIWQSIWLFVFAAAGTAKDPSQSKSIGTLMIVSACLFILGFATSWAPGVWILTGETFPTATRAKQSALATSSNWTWNFLIAFFTPFITKSIHFRYGFVFAACNLAAAVFVYFFLYESSRLTLEDVDNMYNDPRCKPWTSGSWVPEGYSSRTELKRAKPRPVSGATTSTERTLQDPESGGATIVGKDFVEKEERLAAPAPGPALT